MTIHSGYNVIILHRGGVMMKVQYSLYDLYQALTKSDGFISLERTGVVRLYPY